MESAGKIKNITCYCDNVIDVDFQDVVDLTTAPAAEEQILNGTFMRVTCDKCGK
ncbi:MAG: CpXC domain-containing protein, partial [Spirochaetota bacterium]